jgi:hypothetical protein
MTKLEEVYTRVIKELADCNSTYQGGISHYASLLRSQAVVLEEAMGIVIEDKNKQNNRLYSKSPGVKLI